MIGAALLSTLIFATLVGFFVGWPAAMVLRFFSGRAPPNAPRDDQGWTETDVLWVAIYRLATGRFLPWTPRRHVPWTFLDVVVIVFVAVSLLVGIAALVQGLRGAPANGVANQIRQHHVAAAADVAWKIAAMLMATLYLVIKSRATWRDFGLSWRNLPSHVLIGVVAFVMLAPPVYAIQAAIVWFGKWKYEHPLIEMLQKSPDFGLFLLLAFSACIMAPLSEEWFFRGIVQGWLERAFGWLMKSPQHRLAGTIAAAESPVGIFDAELAGSAPIAAAPVAAALPAPAGTLIDSNPYAASQPAGSPVALVDDEVHEEPFPRSIVVHWLPIFLSAVLFGLAHWGHGPAPIPLTALAIGLGYVYQRTHSIVPVMVVHALFNSVSMLLLYVYMFELHKPLP